MPEPSILCAVLNWNGWHDTRRCLASLRASTYPNLHVVVIDNGSTDGSPQHLTPLLDDLSCGAGSHRGELIALDRNLGFTGGVNVGLRLALERQMDFAFLLNNDATVAPECLSTLVAAIRAQPGVGCAGPKILWAAEPTRIWSAGIDLTWRRARVEGRRDQPDDGRFDTRRLVQGLSGCALLMTRAALERVGLLDDRYFAYYEDLDWCLRAQEAGLCCLYAGDARAYHAGSASANRGAGHSQSALANYYGARNGLLFMASHAPRRERPLALASLTAGLLAAEACVIAGGLALRRPHAGRRARAIAVGAFDAARGRFGARHEALR